MDFPIELSSQFYHRIFFLTEYFAFSLLSLVIGRQAGAQFASLIAQKHTVSLRKSCWEDGTWDNSKEYASLLLFSFAFL